MKKLVIDLSILVVSIAVAVYIARVGLVEEVIRWGADGSVVLVSLVAGAFFTSFFTTAPAIAAFGELSHTGNIYLIAVMGGLGAVVGDFILFLFVRDRIRTDAAVLLKGPRWRRILRILRHWHLMRILPAVGAFIIASPFPDELGLALLGISKMRNRYFFVLSFCMNTIGIFVVELVARSL